MIANIAITVDWRNWRSSKYKVVADDQHLGTVFERHGSGIFTSITSSGGLIGAFSSLKAAAAALSDREDALPAHSSAGGGGR